MSKKTIEELNQEYWTNTANLGELTYNISKLQASAEQKKIKIGNILVDIEKARKEAAESTLSAVPTEPAAEVTQ